MTAIYVDALLRAYPAIKEVWLIGSRANGSAKPSSDWDYLVMADCSTLRALSVHAAFNDPTVDLLVVYDGNNFRKPWPDGYREKKGSLAGWEWRRISGTDARYKTTKPPEDDDWVKEGAAKRVFPRSGGRADACPTTSGCHGKSGL